MLPLDRKNTEEKLDWYRGTIISGVTVIERALGWKLRTYFFPESNTRAAIFYQNILNTQFFNFDRKINVYKQIPYFQKLKSYPSIINSLRSIRKLRNAVAHWELLGEGSTGDEVIIYNPNSFEKIKLNNKLMKEFLRHDKLLLKSFGWTYTFARKHGGKEPNPFRNKRDVEIRAMARLLSKAKYLSK